MAEEARKILVVEDDPSIAETLRLTLTSHSYEVISTDNIDDALELARKERPDLIILDIMLPGGSEGFQFVWKLRKEPEEEVKNIPILVFSAIHQTTEMRFYPDQADGTYGPGEFLPVQGFLDKPVEPQKLIDEVESILKAHGRRKK